MGPVLPCTWPRSGGFDSRRVRPSEALTIADATNRPCLGLFGNAFSALVGGALDLKRCSMGGPGDQRVCDSQPPNAALQEDPLRTSVDREWADSPIWPAARQAVSRA